MDKQPLSHALEQFSQHIREIAPHLPAQIIAIKNLDSAYVYCSQSFMDLLGYSLQQLIGSHDMFISDPNEAARIAEDQQIILEKRSLAFLHIDKIKGKLTALTFIKSPIYNPLNKQVIGILCQVFEFTNSDPWRQLIQSYNRIDDKLVTSLERPKLTKREKQVIFLFLSRLNSQEIAEMLFKMEGRKISKSTIDCLFSDQLFPKFAVFNRQALFSKLVELGYHQLIPLEMLAKHTLRLDNQHVY